MNKTAQNWSLIFKALRSVLGASQYDLSRFTGLTQSKIARIEHGKVKLTYEEVSNLAGKLSITPDQFASGRFDLNENFENEIRLFGLKEKIFTDERYVLASAVVPLLEFILNELQRKEVLEIMRELDIREDIFVIKNHRINIHKFHLLLSSLFQENILSENLFDEIAASNFSSEVYGEKIFHSIIQKTNPIERLGLYYKHGHHLENFSKVVYRKDSIHNAVIKRKFNFGIDHFPAINGIKDTLDRQLWCKYFFYHLRSFLQESSGHIYFHIYKCKCQWNGDMQCEYELQLDV